MADTVEAPKKPDTKMIPETDLIALREGSKSRERKLKEQLEEANRKVEDLTAREKVARLSGVDDDDDVKAVKKYLLEQEEEINKSRAKHEKEVASFQEREKGVRAKELVAEYKQRGVEIDVEALLNSEDMERVSLDRYSVFLAEENKKLKETKTPEPRVFESISAGTSRKMPKDMTNEEFAEFEKTIKSKVGY